MARKALTIQMFVQERNDPCSCGSGKKYKRCCMERDQAIIAAPPLSHEGYEIDLNTSHHSKYPGEDYAKIEKFIDKRQKGVPVPGKLLKEIQQLAERYPEDPQAWTLAASALDLIGEEGQAMTLLKAAVERFPDYLFGKLNYIRILLSQGEIEAAEALFSPAESLRELAPHRKSFHLSEATLFHSTLAYYHLLENNFPLAYKHYEALLAAYAEVRRTPDRLAKATGTMLADGWRQRCLAAEEAAQEVIEPVLSL